LTLLEAYPPHSTKGSRYRARRELPECIVVLLLYSSQTVYFGLALALANRYRSIKCGTKREGNVCVCCQLVGVTAMADTATTAGAC